MSGNNLDRFKFRFWLVDSKKLMYSCGDFPNGVDDLFEWMDDEAIIMQSTGLKDKNGKLIYEGDIIENFAFRDIVIFTEGIFTTSRSVNNQPLNIHTELLVIGNIHENPELLESVE